MKFESESVIRKKISWGSIIGGVVTALTVSMLLSILGTALGLSIINPTSDDIINGADTTIAIWSMISIIVSLAAGAFIAGHLAAVDGLIHGFLVWATSLLVAAIIGSLLAGSAVKATGNIISTIASTSGNLLSSVSSTLEKGASGLTEIGSEIFDKLNIDTQLEPEKLQNDVIKALEKSGIPSLQPQFMQQQLEGAKIDLSDAIKMFVNQPNNSDIIAQNLTNKLKKRTELISQDIDEKALKRALIENTGMSSEQADNTMHTLIKAKNNTAKLINQRLNDAESKINEVKQEYTKLKEQAREQAEAASNALAYAALWAFLALLLGAIISAVAGFSGSKINSQYTKV